MGTGLDRVSEADVAKVGQLIKGIKIAMLTTAERDGTLRSRPMATQISGFDGALWFFTRVHSGKVEEVEGERHVNVSYADVERQRYVSVSGRAALVRDRAKAAQLWTPALKAWFPKGVEDPELGLLRVDVTEVEYWEAAHGEGGRVQF